MRVKNFREAHTMKKIPLAISALAALALIVIFAAIPFYIGTQVEKELAGKIYELKDYGLALVVTSIRGGVRSSDVEFDLKIYHPQAAALAPNPARDEKGAYLTLKGKGVIHHGPVAFGWPIITPFVAGGEAGLRLPGDVNPVLMGIVQHFFGDRPPITISARMGLGDTLRFGFSVPDFNGRLPGNAPGTIQWGGLSAWLEMAKDGNSFSMGSEAPGIKIVGSRGDILATDIRLSGKSAKAGDSLWLGGLTFSIGSMAGRQGKENFQLEDFKYTVGLSENGGNLEIALKIAMKKGQGRDFSINPSGLEMKLKGINRALFEDMLKKFLQRNKTVADLSRLLPMMAETWRSYRLKFRNMPPRLELTGLNLDTNHGKLRIEGAIEPPWMDPFRRPSPSYMAAGTKAHLSFKLSKSLVAEVFERHLRQKLRALARNRGLTLDKSVEERMIKNAIDLQMGSVLQQKYLVERGDHYTIDWTLEQGVFKVNGEVQTALLREFLRRLGKN